MRVWTLGVLVLLFFSGLVFAQGNPSNPGDFTNNPHPDLPWFGLPYPGHAQYGVVPQRAPSAQDRRLYGTVVRHIRVLPRTMTIQVYVPGPASVPGAFQRQLVRVPGYIVTETTTGYLYPQRTVLEQLTPGVYRWRVQPPLFTRK